MKYKQKIILVIAFLIAVLCGAATNTPWDGTAWDVTAPDIDQPIGNHYKEMYDLRKGVAIRINKEHETLATSSAGGVHVQGSARVWIQDATPALQPNGDALDAGDNGMIWIDTDSTPDNLFYILTDFSDPVADAGWTLISDSLEGEMVSAAHQWAAVQTFDLQTVHTLGILSNASVTLGAGADLVGAADSVINMNAFDVSAAGVGTIGTSLDIAGTIAVVGTIDDDTMAAATDTTIATSESIKAYADAISALLPSGLAGGNESIGETKIGEWEIKWGNKDVSAGDTTITFTTEGLTAFSNACFQVFPAWGMAAVPLGADPVSSHTFTTTTFKVHSNIVASTTVRWFAIGR